ncbi:MAG: hypothetical protein JW821_04475, partial [Deltaproteobacteria bacterium]|nr:hypothetical protein [Deltaproteobacteria bacterium]
DGGRVRRGGRIVIQVDNIAKGGHMDFLEHILPIDNNYRPRVLFQRFLAGPSSRDTPASFPFGITGVKLEKDCIRP